MTSRSPSLRVRIARDMPRCRAASYPGGCPSPCCRPAGPADDGVPGGAYVSACRLVYDKCVVNPPATKATQAKASGSASGSESKSQSTYSAIRAKIISGAYGPGYRLVLDELSREMGISTVPIREAIRRLEAEGYVDFQRNVGARGWFVLIAGITS